MGAGAHFNLSEKSLYVHTLVGTLLATVASTRWLSGFLRPHPPLATLRPIPSLVPPIYPLPVLLPLLPCSPLLLSVSSSSAPLTPPHPVPLAEAIDKYSQLRRAGDLEAINPALNHVVDGMFRQCLKDGQLKQVCAAQLLVIATPPQRGCYSHLLVSTPLSHGTPSEAAGHALLHPSRTALAMLRNVAYSFSPISPPTAHCNT